MKLLPVAQIASIIALMVPSVSIYAQAITAEKEKPEPTANLDQGLKPESNGEQKAYYAAGPEGKTLPEKVLRLRIPLRWVSADSGFDKDGKKLDLGLKLNLMASGLVIEYGITDALSIQVLAPVVLQNQAAMNGTKFKESSVYKEKYAGFIKQAAALYAAQGVCEISKCIEIIEGGQRTAFATPLTLPTGETLVVPAGVAVKDAASAFILNAAAPAKGRTGVGDLEVGALYSFAAENGPLSDSAVYAAAGLGLRVPTGSFKDVPSAQRGTGRGTLDLGLRVNLDYNPADGVFISWQNQSEMMLAKAKKMKSSLVNASELNNADPTTAAAIAAGSDGKANEQTFSRNGVRNVGFLKAAWGVGNVAEDLACLGLNAQWKYDLESEERLNNVSQGARSKLYTLSLGASFDGLAEKIPVQVDVDAEFPLGGVNKVLAAKVYGLTLKGYYKF